MTPEDAQKHIRNAWIAGVVSAAFTLLIIGVTLSGSSLFQELDFGWAELLDVAFVLGLSYGVFRKSRVSAVLLLTYFVLARIYLWVALGSLAGWPVAILFGYFFVQGVRGTFAHHALAPEVSARGGSRRWIWILGGTIAALGVALVAGLVLIGIHAPDTKVIPGGQVPKLFAEQIRRLGVLEEEEQIRFFYSDALLNIEDGFYLLTDRQVVVYSRRFEEPAIRVPFAEIESLDADWSDSWWTDSQISLELRNQETVGFPLSIEGGGDKRFYKALQESRQAARPPGSE